MKESDAKNPQISSSWWDARKPKTFADVKLSSALKAYEKMAAAFEFKNQLTQLDIMLNLLEPLRKQCEIDSGKKGHKETAQALENYKFVLRKERSLVERTIAQRVDVENALDAMLAGHEKLLVPLYQSIAKNVATLKILNKQSAGRELDESTRQKLLDQVDKLVSDVFAKRDQVKQTIKQKTERDCINWIQDFSKLKGESASAGNQHLLAQPKYKELHKMREEHLELVDWVVEHARDVRGGKNVE